MMSKNIVDIPYTEIQERGIQLGRIGETSKSKFRGLIHDCYIREIPSKFDWDFLIASSGITTIGEYKVGTVSANTGDTTLVFSSDVSLDSSFTGRKVKVSGNDVVYKATFLNTTGLTISPSFQGASNASGNSYTIFQDTYALASDFERFPKDGGFYKWEGGRKTRIVEESYQRFTDNQNASPSDSAMSIKFVGEDTAGCPLIQLDPPPNKIKNYGYDYVRQLQPLKETSAGTVSISANGTTVTGNTNCRFNEATTGDFLRINAFGVSNDSSWYPIIAIAHDSSLTLKTAFANSGVVDASYVISSAPDLPARLQMACIYGPLRNSAFDQNDETSIIYDVKMAEVLSDSKRIHVTRKYSIEIDGLQEDYLYRR